MQLSDFKNESLCDFQAGSHSSAEMQQAIKDVAAQLRREYPIVIGGEHVQTEAKFHSFNPAQPTQIVGTFSKGTADLAGRAIRSADAAFSAWSRTSIERRVELLVQAARIMRDRKHYLAAWLIYEVGKTWKEADSDVAEAIDFCEFYCREMLRLGKP